MSSRHHLLSAVDTGGPWHVGFIWPSVVSGDVRGMPSGGSSLGSRQSNDHLWNLNVLLGVLCGNLRSPARYSHRGYGGK